MLSSQPSLGIRTHKFHGTWQLARHVSGHGAEGGVEAHHAGVWMIRQQQQGHLPLLGLDLPGKLQGVLGLHEKNQCFNIWATKQNLIAVHYTGCLIGIPITGYNKP